MQIATEFKDAGLPDHPELKKVFNAIVNMRSGESPSGQKAFDYTFEESLFAARFLADNMIHRSATALGAALLLPLVRVGYTTELDNHLRNTEALNKARALSEDNNHSPARMHQLLAMAAFRLDKIITQDDKGRSAIAAGGSGADLFLYDYEEGRKSARAAFEAAKSLSEEAMSQEDGSEPVLVDAVKDLIAEAGKRMDAAAPEVSSPAALRLKQQTAEQQRQARRTGNAL